MRTSFMLLLMFGPSLIWSQTWQFQAFQHQYHYLASQDSVVHTLALDSTQAGPTTVAFFNQRTISIDDCGDANTPGPGVRIEQPNFLMKRWENLHDTLWILTDTSIFRLYPQAQPGQNWTFDPAHGLTATVQSLTDTLIGGQADSVKVIALSDGSEILLSQLRGIIRFPDFSQSGHFFELIGVAGPNLAFGLQLPSWQDFVNFEVGDRFEYFTTETVFQSNGVEKTHRETQLQLLAKHQPSPDTLQYLTRRIERSTIFFA